MQSALAAFIVNEGSRKSRHKWASAENRNRCHVVAQEFSAPFPLLPDDCQEVRNMKLQSTGWCEFIKAATALFI